MEGKRYLFEVETFRLGFYFVVATGFDDAKSKLTETLSKKDYGFASDRVITNIKLVAEEGIYSDIGKLII